MTVVAARYEKQRIEMVADSQATWGHGRTEKVSHKIMQFDEDFVIGAAGSPEELALMHLFAQVTRPRSTELHAITEWMVQFNANLMEHTGERADNQYILFLDGMAFVIMGFDIQPMQEFAAIGSGSDYALPALFLGASAKQAVECAIEFNAYCGGPIIEIAVPTEIELE